MIADKFTSTLNVLNLKYSKEYLFGGQDEGGSGVGAILVENGALVVAAFVDIFFVLRLLALA